MTTRWLLVLTAVFVVACASKEILPAHSGIVPGGVDLSGQWRLRNDSDDTNRRLDEAEIVAAGGRDDILARPRQKQSTKRPGALVHVFLETGTNLKITQTDEGLFISFDRAIVEEYRFGEYTQVSVGPVVASRSSGWEQEAYVIETLDSEGNKLIERYQLGDNEQLLIRQITLYRKRKVDLSLVQWFDRRNG